jgi:capping protein beta
MSSDEDRLTSVFNLMRRMPPAQTMKSLAGVMELVPDLADDVLANVDQPLLTVTDPKTGKDFILCDYNRDGDAYRSPWSNEFFFPDGEAAEGFVLPANLRSMEIDANKIFDIYRHLYYDTGISSVYFFESSESENDFGAAFLIKKDVAAGATLKKGRWESTHIFKVSPTLTTGEFEYTLTSTVIISMNLAESATGDVDLSGSMTQQSTKVRKTDKFQTHIANMGSLLESMEFALRNQIEAIYIQKTREVLSGARSSTGARDAAWAEIAQSLKGKDLSSLKKN